MIICALHRDRFNRLSSKFAMYFGFCILSKAKISERFIAQEKGDGQWK